MEIPEVHLGGGIAEVESTNRTKSWTLSSEQNVKSDVANAEIKLDDSGMRLLSKLSRLFSYDCCPSEDASLELCTEGITLFQKQAGTLRCEIVLGRVCVLLEVALLFTCLENPRDGCG